MAETFADRLRRLRKARRWSMADLAALAGMHQSGVAKLETGEREPSLATALALARVLQVSIAELAGETGSSLPPVEQGPAERTLEQLRGDRTDLIARLTELDARIGSIEAPPTPEHVEPLPKGGTIVRPAAKVASARPAKRRPST